MSKIEDVRGALTESHARHAAAGSGPAPFHKAPTKTAPLSFGAARIQLDIADQGMLSPAEQRELADHFFALDCRGG